MNNIITITDYDLNNKYKKLNNPRIRFSSRGIVLNKNNKIAFHKKKNKNEYKLIGGGLEEKENPEEAFKREVLEETGCKVKIDNFIGIIKEERSHYNFIQISYVYIAHVIKDTKKLDLTKKEIKEKNKLIWLDIKTAMKVIKEAETSLENSKDEESYFTRFVLRRDYNILEYYKKISM